MREDFSTAGTCRLFDHAMMKARELAREIMTKLGSGTRGIDGGVELKSQKNFVNFMNFQVRLLYLQTPQTTAVGAR